MPQKPFSQQYRVKDNKTGMTRIITWNDPTPPTEDEIDEMLGNKPAAATPAADTSTYHNSLPDWQGKSHGKFIDAAWNLAFKHDAPPPDASPTLYNRAMAATANSEQDNPALSIGGLHPVSGEPLWKSGARGLESGVDISGGMASGLANSVGSASTTIPGDLWDVKNKRLQDMPYAVGRAFAKPMYKVAGVDYDTFESDLANRNYMGAIGDVAPPIAMGALMEGLGRGAPRGSEPTRLPSAPKINVVPPVEPIRAPLQLTEVAGEAPNVKRITISNVSNRPVPRLTEVAGEPPDVRRFPNVEPAAPLQLTGRQQPRALLNAAPELPPVEPPPLISHPSGKVGLPGDVNTPEALRSLDLLRPGHTSSDFEIRPHDYGDLTVQPPDQWDFNQEPTKAPPEPYNQPRSQGITRDKGVPYSLQAEGDRTVPVRITKAGKVRVKDGQFYQTGGREVFISPDLAEMIRRGKLSPKLIQGDYVADQTLASVPNRLRPEVPNVTNLRDLSQGNPKAGAGVPRVNLEPGTGGNWAGEPSTIELGQGAGKTKGARLAQSVEPNLPSAPVRPNVNQRLGAEDFITQQGRPLPKVEEPTPTPSWKSGEGTIDPNRIDVINRKRGGINFKAYEGDVKGEPVHTPAYRAWLDKMAEGAANYIEKNPEATAREIKTASRKYAGPEPFERYEPETSGPRTNRGDINPQNVTEVPEKGGIAFIEHKPSTEAQGRFVSGKDVIEDPNTVDVTYPNREFPKTKQLKNPTKEELKAWRDKGYRVIDKQPDGTTTISVKGEKPGNIKARQVKEKAARTAEKLIAEKLRKNPTIAKDPTFMNAIKAIPDRIRKSALYNEVLRPGGVSGFRKLRTLGDAGNELADLMANERSKSATYGGEHEVKTVQVARTLNPSERLELIDVMSGEKPLSSVTNQKVIDGYKILRGSTEELGNRAIQANVRMKGRSGENIPFQKTPGEYFPQYYPEELYKNPELLREALNNSGKYSSAAIDSIVKQVTEKGERFSPSQHARTLNIPGWKKDLGSLAQYQKEMARAITRAEKYGPMDVADPNSKINQLIEKTANPTEARKIVNDYLGRTEAKGGKKLYNFIAKAQVATKLSQYMATQIGDYGPMAGGLGIRNTLKGMRDVFMDPTGSHDAAMTAGAHSMLTSEFSDELHKGGLGKIYGMNASEKLNRTVTAMAGRYNIKELFERAKSNPKYTPVLQRFVEGDASEVLKQDKLTQDQINYGMRKGIELSTGVPDKLTLSKAFHPDTPILKVPSMFRQYSYTTVRNMVDAIKIEPTVRAKMIKAAKIIAAYQATGEATGDVKAMIKGLVNGEFEKTLKDRGNWVGTGNWAFDRMLANASQSALFGLYGDVLEQGARGRSNVASNFLGGPVIGDLNEAIGAGISAYHGDLKPLEKGAVRRVPLVGPGLVDLLFKKDNSGLTKVP